MVTNSAVSQGLSAGPSGGRAILFPQARVISQLGRVHSSWVHVKVSAEELRVSCSGFWVVDFLTLPGRLQKPMRTRARGLSPPLSLSLPCF